MFSNLSGNKSTSTLRACVVFLTVQNFIEKKTDTLNNATREILFIKNFVITILSLKYHMFCYSECRHVVSTHA